MAEYKFKQVIVMANWLNMRKGKMVAQGAHAAMMILLDPDGAILSSVTHGWINNWINDGMAKICVRADSREELHSLYETALKNSLPAYMITDAGHTEFGGIPTDTALAIGPAPVELVDAITKHLKLL